MSGDEGSAEVNGWKIALGLNSPWSQRVENTKCTEVDELYKGATYPNGSSNGITAKIKILNGMPTGVYNIKYLPGSACIVRGIIMALRRHCLILKCFQY